MPGTQSAPSKSEIKTWVNTRRSQRVVARIRVQVRRVAGTNDATTEVSQTMVVSVHGALIPLEMEVRPGEELVIRHTVSGEEMETRVIKVGEDEHSPKEVAIEFKAPAPHFWQINFPPPDWKRD